MADTGIFKRLRKLFSTGTVVRNVGGKRLKVADTDNVQSFINRRGIDRYHRVYSSMTGGYGSSHGRYEMAAAFQGSRLQLFRDYDMMDADPIISSVMDIYADESTIKNEFGQILSVKSKNNDIQEILNNLFYDVLNVEFNLWPWVRNMVKYGDFFLFLDIDEEYGIVNVIPLSVYETIRVEGEDPGNPFSVKFKIENDFLNLGKKEFDNYELAHFRLLSDTNFLPYGKCLDRTAYVETEHGPKTIDTLEVGQRVWVWNGTEFELSPIKHVIASGVKEILEIQTPRRSIRASENHPILVWDENSQSCVYKTANTLSIKDLLIVSSNEQLQFTLPYLDKNLGDEHNKNGWKNQLHLIPDTPTVDFARLFGFLIGDGWIAKDGTVTFAQGLHDSINEYYVNLLEQFSGKTIRYSSIQYTDEKIAAQAMVSSKMLATVLKNNGFVGTATTKRIPEWVFMSPRDVQLAFIQGLVDADGSVYIDKWNCTRYSLELANENLIRDVQALLQRLNIKVGKIASRQRSNIVIKDIHVQNVLPSYCIYFYLDGEEVSQIKKYDKNLGTLVMTEPVTSIQLDGEHETFDIQVESEHSNFLANGVIVHNSMIEGGRRIWKQLQLMEDAMLVHRIMRAPDKRKVLVDIGNIPPNEIDTHMQRIIDRMKKVPLVDPKTGDYNLRYNMMNITEDFYLPVRGKDSGTDIQNLPGLQFNAIEDIEYLRNKLMAAFKVPKSFLGYEEDATGKATLAAQDVRFARTIERIHRIMISELTKIAIIHLYVQGYTDEDLIDFEIEMSSPSIIFEQEKLNLWKEKIQLSRDAADTKFLSRDWIYHNILNISTDEANNEREAVMKDIEWLAKAEQAAQPPQPGMPGAAPGGMPGAAPGGEAPPEGEPPAEEPPPEEQDAAMNDVDAILASLDEPGEVENELEIEDEELEEAKMGRPRKGLSYGQDNHPRGRDPLGHKQNLDALQGRIQRRTPSKKSPLSLENHQISNIIRQLDTRKNKKLSILNENNILDDTELKN
jgi:intein/homing endonuclease